MSVKGKNNYFCINNENKKGDVLFMKKKIILGVVSFILICMVVLIFASNISEGKKQDIGQDKNIIQNTISTGKLEEEETLIKNTKEDILIKDDENKIEIASNSVFETKKEVPVVNTEKTTVKNERETNNYKVNYDNKVKDSSTNNENMTINNITENTTEKKEETAKKQVKNETETNNIVENTAKNKEEIEKNQVESEKNETKKNIITLEKIDFDEWIYIGVRDSETTFYDIDFDNNMVTKRIHKIDGYLSVDGTAVYDDLGDKIIGTKNISSEDIETIKNLYKYFTELHETISSYYNYYLEFVDPWNPDQEYEFEYKRKTTVYGFECNGETLCMCGPNFVRMIEDICE